MEVEDFDSVLDEVLLPCDTEDPDLEEDELLAGVLTDLPDPELLTIVLRPEEEDDPILEGGPEGELTVPLLLPALDLVLPGTLIWLLVLLPFPLSFLFPKFPLFPVLRLLLLLPLLLVLLVF